MKLAVRLLDTYWGKARPRGDQAYDWHPLAYHSLDVAAAMEAMLAVRPAWLRAVSGLHGLPADETRRRLVLVAALHDLGKFADNFQQKAPLVRERLQPGLTVFTDNRGHGDIGAAFWENWRGRPMALGGWCGAAFAHHGAPVEQSDAFGNAASAASFDDAIAFAEAATALIGAPNDRSPRSKVGPWLVAGLVVLADWIGSNQAWFPYAPPDRSLEDYWTATRAQAVRAVQEANLAEAMAATDFDLAAILAGDPEPSPLQAWAQTQAPSGGRHLYIVEDLTGAGKTEAALILAHRLIRAGAAEGLYWALPTMATANGLYARLADCYRALFSAEGVEPSLVLAHGARDLHRGFQASIGRERDAVYGASSDDVSAEAACAAFVAEDRKKTFLAQVGVGTIDQALLGVLPVRHQSLRLAALARRVLIVDEAHSYDPYMVNLLERVMKFHAAHGGSAIVLSATLTAAQRRRLVAAYDWEASEQATSTAFPLATHVGAAGLAEAASASQRGSRRDLPFRRFDTPDAVMAALLERAEQGACAVYVRNTVKDATAAYAALVAAAPAGVSVDLFHARFTVGDRLGREEEVLCRFGKASTPQQRRGRILVATQVVEQSLDLDFDVMATDLCPMDLMIQRAGRLQRHDHRPPRLDPELWVVSRAADEAVGPDWYAGLFPDAQYVYPDAGQLWRTLRVMTDRGGLPLRTGSPRDLIEPVFGDAMIPTPEGLDPASLRAEARRNTERAVAHLNALKVENFDRGAGAWDSDMRTPTRLGEETTVFRLARWTDGVLTPWNADPDDDRAWRLSEISLPLRRLKTALFPSTEAEAAVRAVQAGWPGRYDPVQVLVMEATEGWSGVGVSGAGLESVMTYCRLEGMQIAVVS